MIMYIPEIVVGIIIGFILGVIAVVVMAICINKTRTKKEDK